MSTNNFRYILADEVGLGKTIEAGMIVKELKSRGLFSRILVVCPIGFVAQRETEMQEKFHEKFQVILPLDYDTIRRLSDSDNIYGQFVQVISPWTPSNRRRNAPEGRMSGWKNIMRSGFNS